MVIADTGFWVALYCEGDADHEAAIRAIDRYAADGFITTQAVITEACHILMNHRRVDVVTNFLSALLETEVEIYEPPPLLLPRAIALMRKYRDLPMDYADASLVLLAEHLGHGRILTTDQRDFGSYRWKNHYPFDNLLEEETS